MLNPTRSSAGQTRRPRTRALAPIRFLLRTLRLAAVASGILGFAALPGACKRDEAAHNSFGGVAGSESTAAAPATTAPTRSKAIDDVLKKIQVDPSAPKPIQSRPSAAPSEERGKAPLPEASPTSPPAVTAEEAAAGASAPQFDNEKLSQAASQLITDLTGALAAGDFDAASKHLLSNEEAQATLTPGSYSILADSLLPQNRDRLKALAEKLKGYKVTHSWKPGNYSVTRGTFKAKLPYLADCELELEFNSVLVIVRPIQLLWLNDKWRIFRVDFK
jgi:hypothetical protein